MLLLCTSPTSQQVEIHLSSMLPNLRLSIAFLNVPSLHPLVLLIRVIVDEEEYGALVECY
jgi:hypothetical protein